MCSLCFWLNHSQRNTHQVMIVTSPSSFVFLSLSWNFWIFTLDPLQTTKASILYFNKHVCFHFYPPQFITLSNQQNGFMASFFDNSYSSFLKKIIILTLDDPYNMHCLLLLHLSFLIPPLTSFNLQLVDVKYFFSTTSNTSRDISPIMLISTSIFQLFIL